VPAPVGALAELNAAICCGIWLGFAPGAVALPRRGAEAPKGRNCIIFTYYDIRYKMSNMILRNSQFSVGKLAG
jgi:hypothetical protein